MSVTKCGDELISNSLRFFSSYFSPPPYVFSFNFRSKMFFFCCFGSYYQDRAERAALFQHGEMIKVYSIPQRQLEASKLISQINEWRMRRQRNANKASKQQIAIRFTADRESEKYYLICVLYTSLPVIGNSILFTNWSLYEPHRKHNLSFSVFWVTESVICGVVRIRAPPTPGGTEWFAQFASGGGAMVGDLFVLSLAW